MRKRLLTGLTAALLTLFGGVYLTATPLAAVEPVTMDCMDDAMAIFNFVVENICDGMTECNFQCTAGNEGVASFSCSCG